MDIPSADSAAFNRLLEIIAKLRGPSGCPWDQRQTPQSIKKYLLEEANELAEAIDQGDASHICEEIGDLFYILTMLTAMADEAGRFTCADALQAICSKMIRRHPHVFGDQPTGSDEELRRQWEAIKAAEQQDPSSP